MKKYLVSILCLQTALLFLFVPFLYAKETKTAKSSFESGSGVGISYKIELIGKDGGAKVVPSSHVFKSGDKIKVYVKTNKAGYLTVMNIGSSGRTHVLFNDSVEGTDVVEIPRKSALRFIGEPGTEKLLIMLSKNPNPFAMQAKKEQEGQAAPQAQAQQQIAPPPSPVQAPAEAQQQAQPQEQPAAKASAKKTKASQAQAKAQAQQQAQAQAQAQQQAQAQAQAQQQAQAQAQAQQQAALQTPPPDPEATLAPPLPMLLASLEGSKDIVLEDDLETGYVVISPEDGYKPQKIAAMSVESKGGENYGVVPKSVIDKGQILTLEIKLKHK